MSEQCHVCGPVKHEAPTVICAPCALDDIDLHRRIEKLCSEIVAKMPITYESAAKMGLILP